MRAVAVLALSSVLLSACAVLQQFAQTPEIKLRDVRVAEAGIMEQVLEFDLALDNPNPFALPLAGMNYTLELGGVKIGDGKQSQAMVLPANGQIDWPVTFRVNSLEIAQGFMQRGGFKNMDYHIFGTLFFSQSAPFAAMPFDKKGQVGDAAGEPAQ